MPKEKTARKWSLTFKNINYLGMAAKGVNSFVDSNNLLVLPAKIFPPAAVNFFIDVAGIASSFML